jgi:hypothetical protein
VHAAQLQIYATKKDALALKFLSVVFLRGQTPLLNVKGAVAVIEMQRNELFYILATFWLNLRILQKGNKIGRGN